MVLGSGALGLGLGLGTPDWHASSRELALLANPNPKH